MRVISYTYDTLNRLVKVVNSAGTSQYVYAAGYDRIQKITPGGHVRTYLGELAEVTETGAFTDYIFAGDTRVATVDASGLYYHSSDHLSSASLITNTSAGVVQKLDYYPFGSERVNEKFASFETRFSFTDQEKDSESGLMYYGARYYDPVIGRFTQVDPVVIDTTRKEFSMALTNPQLLNAYSYVGNNPLKYVDYEGEFAFLIPIAAYAIAYAPVWVPIAVTAVSSAGAAVAAYFYGQGLGYYAGGDDRRAEQTIGNEMLALEATTTVVGGMMSVEAMGRETTNNNTVSRQSANQQQSSSNVTIPTKQLQEKFKHASDFGIKGNYNKTTATEFESALQEHVNDQNTQVIQGTYRNQSATLYLNQNSGLNVVTKPNGEFVTGYKLGKEQMQNVLTRGSLQ